MRTMIIIFVAFIVASAANAQEVNEIKTVIEDEFELNSLLQTVSSQKGQYLACISCESKNDSTNVLYLSDDAGQTWYVGKKDKHFNIDENHTPLPGNWAQHRYTAVERPSENVIFLMTIMISRKDMQYYDHLMRTTDKGETWDVLTINNDSVRCYGTLMSMYDDKHGIIATTKFDTISVDPLERTIKKVIFETGDGGDSWVENPFTAEDTLIYCKYIKSIAPGEYIVVYDEPYQKIYHTSDAGESYTRYEIDNLLGASISMVDRTLYVNDFKGNNKGSKIYKTTDFGKSWSELLDSNNKSDTVFAAFDFYDDNNAIAADQAGMIIRTSDGGNSWTKEYIPSDMHNLHVRHINYHSPRKATIVTDNCVLEMTGNYVMQPPNMEYVILDEGNLDYQLIWDEIAGASSYHIQLSARQAELTVEYLPEDFEDKIIIDTVVSGTSSLSLSGLLDYSNDNHARVSASGHGMNSDWSRVIRFTTCIDSSLYFLKKAELLYPNSEDTVSYAETTFKWKPVENAEKYTLLITSSSNSYDPDFDQIIQDITTTEYTVQNLEPNHWYFWRVDASCTGLTGSQSDLRIIMTEDDISVHSSIINNEFLLSANPNPITKTSTISYNLKQSSDIQLSLYDMRGVEIAVLKQGFTEAGPHELVVNRLAHDISAGNYILTLSDAVNRSSIILSVQ